MLLISRSHDFRRKHRSYSVRVNGVLGDITRFFEMGCRFTKLSPSRGRSFCGCSNSLLCSLLVMFLRARHWQVGACVIHIQPAKRTLRMCTKLAFLLPTYFYFTSCRNCPPPPMCDRMLWLALFTEQWLDQPIIPYRGAISDPVGKTSQPLWQSRRWHHIRLSDLLQQLFQQVTSSKSTSSLCPFISLNKIRKWLFVFENI